MVRLGIYLIGARGNVATCTIAGLHAIKRGLAPTTGLVTATEKFCGCRLASLDDIAVGGCDIVATPLEDKARALAEDRGVLPPTLVEKLRDDLRESGAHLDRATPFDVHGIPSGGYARFADSFGAALAAFKERHGADSVVVVNLASTEPSIALSDVHKDDDSFGKALRANRPGSATQSMLYAWSAFAAGVPFVNFTPSQANEVAALSMYAGRQKLPHAGKDGKTGETLVKTVLAPMFRGRNLDVTSWLANNYLGNGDGKTLSDPAARKTKLASKDEALRSILGSDAHLSTDIGFAPDMGDWKTAMDLIHFEGFLGVRMSMQFVWQGCDSALAAPLVLDLARLTDRARRANEVGALEYLASFFKSPLGTDVHAFADQLAMLEAHADTWRS